MPREQRAIQAMKDSISAPTRAGWVGPRERGDQVGHDK